MNISFIVTTFNIEGYVQQCLESLRPCLRAGDQVVLVDDGSTDTTPDIIAAFIDSIGLDEGVEWTPIFLGTNTIGGVGIPGNIGLDHATREVVFFVDGDDYLVAEGFAAARAAYEARPTDIALTDYLEFDQAARRTKPPADSQRWAALLRATKLEEIRLAALAMIAVPWRKFYRRSFLVENRIRYPEGDFFFEDNPFHWKVCMAAESIGVFRDVVCHHRVNRPGQTMASTGRELLAFFDHFKRILATVPDGRGDMRRQAALWLLGNMAWHIPRLQAANFLTYAARASDAFKMINDEEWAQIARDSTGTVAWHYANHLRRGETWAVVEAWQAKQDREARQRIEKELPALKKIADEVSKISKRLSIIETELRTSRELLHSQQAIAEFDAIQALVNKGPLSVLQQQYGSDPGERDNAS